MLAVKDKLARGEVASMVMVNYPSAALVEHTGKLGFDAAFIDCEKGNATTEHIENMCRGARAAGICAVVRPWSADAGLISRYLDLGATGIMQAGIESVGEAQALVAAVRYARWSDWQDKLVIGMIESPQAIALLPQLLDVEGIDAWFVGPNDLAHRMGFPGQAAVRAEVRDAVAGALRTISAAGKVAGTLATPESTPAVVAAGARLLLTRTTELMAVGAQQFHDQVRRAAQTRSNAPESGHKT
jgi:2-keto-3-deoxy-L-rhamnonate aldolase RhmA